MSRSPVARPWWPTFRRSSLLVLASLPTMGARALAQSSEAPPALPTATVAVAPPDPADAPPPLETLSLDQALARFRDGAPTEQILAGRVAEAQAVVRLATAAALPIVATQGGYVRNSDDAIMSFGELLNSFSSLFPFPIDTSELPPDLVIQPLSQWTAGANVTVPLVVPSAWADIGAAKQMVHAAEGGTEAVRQQAEGGLVKAAWMARAAEEVLAASDHAVHAAESHQASAQRRLDAGTGTQLEVLQAATELVRRESDRVQAAANLDKARRAMGALLGVSGPIRVQVTDGGTVPSTADGAAATALASRPDLHAAEASVDAAGRSITSAWLRNLPTISGSASVFASDVAYATGEKTGWKLGVTATWVAYDGGARYGLKDKATAQQMQAEGNVRQLSIDADRQARDAVAALDVALERLRLANQAAETAARAEATAGRLYEAGLLNSLDALDAQQVRLDVDVARAGAIAQVGVARADLMIATGLGWRAP